MNDPDRATLEGLSDDSSPDIERFLRVALLENYELLRLETNQALSPAARENAFNQVMLYWQKLKDVANSITDTEVRLALPAQHTPQGRPFVIEGVVDIVRDKDTTVMYDIKTHDADFVRANTNHYSDQLNVYAYIWQELRGEPLERTTIIATRYPESMQSALDSGNEDHISHELEKWNPLIDIPFDREGVEETVDDFGRTIDAIEDGAFTPPPAERLSEREKGRDTLFATRVCNNCDARFSCSSYREYVQTSRKTTNVDFRTYFMEVGSDAERDARLTANLDATQNLNQGR
jgi:hypothetical protein